MPNRRGEAWKWPAALFVFSPGRGLRTGRDAGDIRILGSFIGPGGLATPDDVEAYECVQRGVVATAGDPRPEVDWSDISRGMERESRGEPARNVDEAGIRGFWRHWDDLVTGTKA